MRLVAVMLAGLLAALISTSVGLAADPTREDRMMKLPETPADHAALAKIYDENAAEWRKEADIHRKMAAEYKKSRGDPKDVATMEKHCAQLAKDADKLAADAKTMADYHRLRGKEAK
ncbi:MULTISPECIES: hypothetical protein [Anaeromyxobacter]|uniref:hypothetical protein n=1 Tax=Anaeromyxobacter TaxID=161492 RepID=UPI001F5A3D2D|nr:MULTISPECIES: hypothetical protein [unclassified Anaeromyxobacter]